MKSKFRIVAELMAPLTMMGLFGAIAVGSGRPWMIVTCSIWSFVAGAKVIEWRDRPRYVSSQKLDDLFGKEGQR